MPFGEINGEFVHISRKSICEECTKQSNCIPAFEMSGCKDFTPKELIFFNCRECGISYEVHSAWKNDFLDTCPDCDKKHRSQRLERLGD